MESNDDIDLDEIDELDEYEYEPLTSNNNPNNDRTTIKTSMDDKFQQLDKIQQLQKTIREKLEAVDRAIVENDIDWNRLSFIVLKSDNFIQSPTPSTSYDFIKDEILDLRPFIPNEDNQVKNEEFYPDEEFDF